MECKSKCEPLVILETRFDEHDKQQAKDMEELKEGQKNQDKKLDKLDAKIDNITIEASNTYKKILITLGTSSILIVLTAIVGVVIQVFSK